MLAEFVERSRRDVQAAQTETGAFAEQPANKVNKMDGTAPPSQGIPGNCRENGRRRLGDWHDLAKRPPNPGRGAVLLTEAFGWMSSGTVTGLIAVNLTDRESTITICR